MRMSLQGIELILEKNVFLMFLVLISLSPKVVTNMKNSLYLGQPSYV